MDLAAFVKENFPKRKRKLPNTASIPEGSIVEIFWIDALSYAIEWQTWETATGQKGMPTVSVGYLVTDTPDHYSIAMILNTEAIGSGLVIPKSCVYEVKWIK
jgi:predicted transcriptional regulator